jgi:RimJ/RimL family protein N-acetyltransferase
VDGHPLARILEAAVEGRFPPADGSVCVLPPWDGPADAVVAFSAHSLIIADLDPTEVQRKLPSDDPGAPMSAAFLGWLRTRLATRSPGIHDLVVAAPGLGEGSSPELIAREDLWTHPRVVSGSRLRSNLRLYSDRESVAVLTLGKGLVGRTEVSIEIDREHRGRGLGRRLARAALSLIPRGEPLFAQVSPGNVASVRAFLAAGYRPICAEMLFLKTQHEQL